MIPFESITRLRCFTLAAISGENFLCFALIGSPSVVLIRTVQFGISPTGSFGEVMKRPLTESSVFRTLSLKWGSRCERSRFCNISENSLALSSSEFAEGTSGVQPLSISVMGVVSVESISSSKSLFVLSGEDAIMK